MSFNSMAKSTHKSFFCPCCCCKATEKMAHKKRGGDVRAAWYRSEEGVWGSERL